jgi:hypothetical protein
MLHMFTSAWAIGIVVLAFGLSADLLHFSLGRFSICLACLALGAVAGVVSVVNGTTTWAMTGHFQTTCMLLFDATFGYGINGRAKRRAARDSITVVISFSAGVAASTAWLQISNQTEWLFAPASALFMLLLCGHDYCFAQVRARLACIGLLHLCDRYESCYRTGCTRHAVAGTEGAAA